MNVQNNLLNATAIHWHGLVILFCSQRVFFISLTSVHSSKMERISMTEQTVSLNVVYRRVNHLPTSVLSLPSLS